MKKMMIRSGCIALVLVSFVFISYGEMQKIAISKANLSELQGKWEGSRTIGTGESRNTDLEISNDSLPLECKLTVHDVRRQGKGGKTETHDFKGKINDQGNLIAKKGNLDVELSLYDDGGKKKLEGSYFLAGAKGTMSFKKK